MYKENIFVAYFKKGWCDKHNLSHFLKFPDGGESTKRLTRRCTLLTRSRKSHWYCTTCKFKIILPKWPVPLSHFSRGFTEKLCANNSHSHMHTHRQTASHLHPLSAQCTRLSSILLHDFISLCGCAAPVCFWQLYGGLAGPHSLFGSVNWVFVASSFPPAW